MRKLLHEYFTKRGFDITCCESAEEAIEKFAARPMEFEFRAPPAQDSNLEPLADKFDAILTDVKMPGTDGLTLCEILHNQIPDLPVIVMTAYGSMETAVAALRAGAFDFVTKPVEMELLLASLKRATEHRLLKRQLADLAQQLHHSQFPDLVGESEPMQQLKRQLPQFADSDASVLLTGESGVGKEVVARSLHAKSRRADQPFVAVNCAALSKTLIESELFGHVKGAFTDAQSDRDGLFIEADGGTLFLDEIGELHLEMQPKLLRALEQRVVRPVGGSKDDEKPFDIRLITATNRDLQAQIEEGRFREDLFYRINVVEIHVPPLRARATDVILIANHLLGELARKTNRDTPTLTPEAMQKLLAYNWPGNVRELRNVMQRAMILTNTDEIGTEQLPAKIVNFKATEMVLGDHEYQPLATLADIEDRYIQYVLEHTEGNRGQAARILGIDRKTLYRKMKVQDDENR